jgi:hypothetical protein
MKKWMVGIACLAAALLVVLGIWRFRAGRPAAGKAAGKLELRARMVDEDAPRPVEPTLALQVNEGAEATVFAGNPVWFTVGTANGAAANEIAASRVLAARLARLPADDPDRERLRADYERRKAPAEIALGDAAHPWTDAVQLQLVDDQGAQHPLPFAVRVLGNPAPTVSLNAVQTAQAVFGSEAVSAGPGTYAVAACLGPTGAWKSRVCSDAVKLTVAAADRLTAEQHRAADRQGARFAFLAGDPQLLETYGRRLVAADPGSIAGHMYLGEAQFRRQKWAEAMQEFTTANTQFALQHPNALERPRFLLARISQLMEKTPEGK